MPELRFVHVHRGLGFKGWAMVVVALALFAGIAIAIALLAVGLFLILVPAMVITALSYYLFRGLDARARPADKSPIIDAEFRVLPSREDPFPRD